jgi:hypothetical protein
VSTGLQRWRRRGCDHVRDDIGRGQKEASRGVVVAAVEREGSAIARSEQSSIFEYRI